MVSDERRAPKGGADEGAPRGGRLERFSAGNEGAVRVVLADEQALVRSALRVALGADERIDVVGEAASAVALLAMAAKHNPDVIVADYRLSDAETPELIATLRAQGCAAEIVILTSHDDRREVRRAMDAGARAFLTKRTTGMGRLGKAVIDAAHGIETLSNDALAMLVTSIRLECTDSGGDWTPRECEVLRLAAEGASNAEIARALFLSESTVKYHIGRLLEKTGARNRAELVAFAYRDGLMDSSAPLHLELPTATTGLRDASV